ncbi:hypothetical protein AGMMS49944_19240 [Spirochaetia bacterium]|nr:hypothetical protein AGMMS49944_19240 [Spirochaetia bacterium]
MRISRNPAIIAISASLAAGVLLFFLGTGGRVSGNPGARYAVLTLDDSWPDRDIRELLAGQRLGNTIGESSQWVLLDDFGSLEKVPLDTYSDRVESFDLRNDGYAERLRSFFVFQGKRRLFIPLKGAGDLTGRVAAALGDIPFSLSVLTPPAGPQSVVLSAILFVLAAALTLYCSGEVLLTALLLPLWAVPAEWGVPGFAVIAVLAGLSRFLREPVRDYFMARRYGKSFLPGFVVPGAALFFLALGGITILGALPPLTVILGFLFFLAILALSILAELLPGVRRTLGPMGHIRFRPVPIADIAGGSAGRPSSYALIMAPFTLAALVLLLVSGAAKPIPVASRDWTGWKSPLALDAKAFAEVYSAHVAFQRAFSRAPLGSPSETAPVRPYLSYVLAEDGLLDGPVEDSADSGVFEIPPFPLEGLIDFLTNYAYTDPGLGSSGSRELMCLLVVLGLSVPLMFRDRRRPLTLAMYMDKRIAA